MTTATADAPARCSKAEFARLHGWRSSYVTKLDQEGRLVLTDDGLVDVRASLARINATTNAPERADPAVTGPDYVAARDRNEHYTAELQRLKYEREVGTLLLASDVRDTVANAAATLAAALDALPQRLAPQIAALPAGDEVAIRTLIADHIHDLRAELARGFGALTPPA